MTSLRRIIELRLPRFPECWESCGNCANGNVIIDDVLVFPGDRVARNDVLIVLETGKVALDIPSPESGTVLDVCVAPGDTVCEHQLYMTLELSVAAQP